MAIPLFYKKITHRYFKKHWGPLFMGSDPTKENSIVITMKNCTICDAWAIIDLGNIKKEIDITESILEMAKRYNVKTIYREDGQIIIQEDITKLESVIVKFEGSWWISQGDAIICVKCHEEIPPLGDYKKCPFHEDCPDCDYIRIWDAEQDIFFCGNCGNLEPVME